MKTTRTPRDGDRLCYACLSPHYVFVFGSNELGIHGAGAADHAYHHHGAILGVGEGHRFNSYAIPTKRTPNERRSLEDVAKSVEIFKEYARTHATLDFYITRVGCGLAGFTDAEISPLFADSPANCILPDNWIPENPSLDV